MGGADFRRVREEELSRILSNSLAPGGVYKLHAPPEGLREGASGRPRSSKAPSESRVTFTDHRSPEFIRGRVHVCPRGPRNHDPVSAQDTRAKSEDGER